VDVARHASPTWRLARIKQHCPTGQTLPEGALAPRSGWYTAARPPG
jgi:hypothetical protein